MERTNNKRRMLRRSAACVMAIMLTIATAAGVLPGCAGAGDTDATAAPTVDINVTPTMEPTAVPTEVPIAEPTAIPPEEPMPTATLSPDQISVFRNRYERYVTNLLLLLHGEEIPEYVCEEDYPPGYEHDARCYIELVDGKAVIESSSTPEAFTNATDVVFEFPDASIIRDIFPDGMELREGVYLPEIPDEKRSFRVYFGGDWLLAHIGYEASAGLIPDIEGVTADERSRDFAWSCLLKTEDNWQTWEQIDTSAIDEMKYSIVLGGGVSPSGIAFIHVTRMDPDPHLKYEFIDTTVYRTLDWGKSWEKAPEFDDGWYNFPVFDGDDGIWAIGMRHPRYYITHDGGLTWTYDEEMTEKYDGY